MPIDMNALARLGAQIRIKALIAEIDALVDAFPDLGKAPARAAEPGKSGEPTRRKRRTRPATKATINATVKRGGGTETSAQPAAAAPEAPKKRTISAAGKARIAAAQKKRWAAIKRAKKQPKK